MIYTVEHLLFEKFGVFWASRNCVSNVFHTFEETSNKALDDEYRRGVGGRVIGISGKVVVYKF